MAEADTPETAAARRAAERAAIAELEREAREQPGRYRLRVAGLIVLGQAIVFLWVAAALGIGVVVIGVQVVSRHVVAFALKFEFLLLGAVWVMLRALWVRIEPPTGRELSREEAPELFRLVEGHARALRAPTPHRVLIDSAFNAAMAQTPRWGVLGGWQNDLVLGLPLMQALSPDEFSAVVAHELGHLSASHGRFGVWVYRVRLGWLRIGMAFAERRGMAAMLKPFFQWYLPRLDTTTLALARRHEYEADRAAMERTSALTAATALARLDVVRRWLDGRFWAELAARARHEESPPRPFEVLPERLGSGLPPDDVRRWLAQAFASRSEAFDTHPSTSERVAAMGVPVEAISLDPPPVSATTLLGAAAGRLVDETSREWQDATREGWGEHRKHLLAKEAELAMLRERARIAPLDLDSMWERIGLERELEGDEAAVPLLRSLLESRPDHASGLLVLGSILLSRGDVEGVQHLERLLQRDADALPAVANEMSAWCRARGRVEDAESWEDRGRDRAELLAAAEAERNDITRESSFEPHGLADDAVREVRATLAEIAEVGEAYLVRRSVVHLPDRPAWLLVVRPSRGPLGTISDERAQTAVQRAVQAPLPMPTLVVAAHGPFGWTAAPAAAVPEARLK